MSDKRKISTILGICGATVLAAGGSIFLTNTGLSLVEQSQQVEGETEPGLGAQTKETEQPITVEQFSKTKDSFTVSSKTASDTKTNAGNQNTSGTGNAADTSAAGTSGENSSMMYATGGVNVRSSAGVEGDILGTLQVGEGVTVTGNSEGNWIEVTYNGQTGYVSGNYLQNGSTGGNGSTGSSSGSTVSQTEGTDNSSSNGSSGTDSNSAGSNGGSSNTGNTPAVITWNVTSMSGTMYATGDVNVRTGAGTSNDRIGGLSAGSSVTVTGSTDNGWIQVSYDGQTGYVAGNYLSWDKPSGGGSSGGNSGGSSGAWDDSYTYDLSSRYVSEDELAGYSASELAIIRNEIFARHGRIFTKQTYKDYFSQKTWYEPTYDPSYFDANLDSFLNDYEWANLAVVQKLEDAKS